MSLNIHFTIIDNRFVIIPIFTTTENQHPARHGILIFDDKQGDLVRSLNDMYEQIDAYARPIEVEQLILSDGR